MAIVTPTDRPKSDGNRCIIEVLVAFVSSHVPLCLCVCVWGGGLCDRTESDLVLFLFLHVIIKQLISHVDILAG